MKATENIENIELRSEEVREILGTPPKWIIRFGITVISIVILLLLIGAWFFKLPHIVRAKATITTINPPASLNSLTSGKIIKLFYVEKQEVLVNSTVAVIENSADFDDVMSLKVILDSLTNYRLDNDKIGLSLGELQKPYRTLVKLVNEYNDFLEIDYHNEKIKILILERKGYKDYQNQLLEKLKIEKRVLDLSEKHYKREEILYKTNVYSEVDIEKAERSFLENKKSYNIILNEVSELSIKLNEIEHKILDLKLIRQQDLSNLENSIEEALNNLKGQIKIWEKNYVIKSPISGIISFSRIWSTNQYVSSGEKVATVIPINGDNIIAKLQVPSKGIGKVKVGQDVNIKFDNYPYMEYGVVRGMVKNISMVPSIINNNSIYTAEIEIPDKLITNYGKELEFSQEMTGSADIITDEIPLLVRLWNPLKLLLSNNIYR